VERKLNKSFILGVNKKIKSLILSTYKSLKNFILCFYKKLKNFIWGAGKKTKNIIMENLKINCKGNRVYFSRHVKIKVGSSKQENRQARSARSARFAGTPEKPKSQLDFFQ
jgi:hypothetical protein